jgi:hypothetical protein
VTFEELGGLYSTLGPAGLSSRFEFPLLIPLEPWARTTPVSRAQFGTLSQPAARASLPGGESTGAAFPALRLLHTNLGDRYPATLIDVQDVRKTQRNVYAHVAVGRSVNNDVVFDQPSVSRFHADLRVIDGSYLVRDAKSRNGTRLNGESVVAPHGQPIRSGDVVTFGEASCLFCDPRSPDLAQVLGLLDR